MNDQQCVELNDNGHVSHFLGVKMDGKDLGTTQGSRPLTFEAQQDSLWEGKFMGVAFTPMSKEFIGMRDPAHQSDLFALHMNMSEDLAPCQIWLIGYIVGATVRREVARGTQSTAFSIQDARYNMI